MNLQNQPTQSFMDAFFNNIQELDLNQVFYDNDQLIEYITNQSIDYEQTKLEMSQRISKNQATCQKIYTSVLQLQTNQKKRLPYLAAFIKTQPEQKIKQIFQLDKIQMNNWADKFIQNNCESSKRQEKQLTLCRENTRNFLLQAFSFGQNYYQKIYRNFAYTKLTQGQQE